MAMTAESNEIYFDSREEFRQWLHENHAKKQEQWMGFYKKSSGLKGIEYTEAVLEALCFGWIDGKSMSVDAQRYKMRFTPRKKGSIWSAANLKRIEELKKQGKMHPSGLEVFEKRDQRKANLYSFEQEESPKLPEEYENQLKQNDVAWAWWVRQAESYRKTASWLVISAKKEETRQSRLRRLIEDSERGEKLKELRW
jgi:uncharacterized protein YdeI (YjbR/CyaY-like superfamily)